jgi:hypothetical protein
VNFGRAPELRFTDEEKIFAGLEKSTEGQIRFREDQLQLGIFA